MRGRALVMTVTLWVFMGLTSTLRPYMGGDNLSLLATLKPAGSALAQTARCEDWEHGVIRAEGRAAAPDWARNPAQAHILALEGAKTMAYKELAECISGVRVAGGTTVKKAMTEDQEAAMAVQGVINGARVVREDVVTVAGALMGVVALEVPLHGDRGLGGQLPPKLRPSATESQPTPEARPARPVPSTPSSPASPVDGLILDAGKLDAYPALYPEVQAEGGQTLFHWHSVDREQRALFGRVTNTVEKAKALLREQGAGNPLVVRVARMQDRTTYVIRAEDAKQVFSTDLDAQFLRKNRVVFVLDRL